MSHPQTFHGVIGSILKDTVDLEGSQINFSQPRIKGIGRYFRAKGIEEDFPVLLDLDLGVDLSILGHPRAFFGLRYVLAEVVYNSIKAYRDSEKNTDVSRNREIRVLAYETRNDYRIEIQDRAGGVPESILKTGLPGERTIRRTRERKTGGGIGFETMGKMLKEFNGYYEVDHIKEDEKVVGTNVTIVITKL